MSCYFVCGKAGTKKADGSWYGVAYILRHDQYGAPEIKKVWYKDHASYDQAVAPLSIGAAVAPVYGANDKIVDLVPSEHEEPMLIPDEFFVPD